MPLNLCLKELRIFITPNKDAVCKSCPHACMTPGFLDLKFKLVSSSIGSASKSALSAMVFKQLSFLCSISPEITTTIPFSAIFSVYEIFQFLSNDFIYFEVSYSLNDNSGYICKCLLIETISPKISFDFSLIVSNKGIYF